MLEAANAPAPARRQARAHRGERARVDRREELAEKVKRRDDYLVDLDIQQMLDAKNERRKRKGLPPLTLEEFEAGLGGPAGVRALIVGGGERALALTRALGGRGPRRAGRGRSEEPAARRSRRPGASAGSATPTASARCATRWRT